MAGQLSSASLLGELHRHSATRHENNAGKTLEQHGLSCPVEVDTVDIGLEKPHPILRISNVLKVLASHDKLSLLWGSDDPNPTAALAKFWRRFRTHQGSHEVFVQHAQQLHRTIPILLHADEGQTLKSAGIMVISWESPLGLGVSTQDAPTDMGLNYMGSSFKTRFLISVLLKRIYLKKVKASLDNLVSEVAAELKALFFDGIELAHKGQNMHFFVAFIGLKGDWPIHQKLGHLRRHFSRMTKKDDDANAAGICHLCEAGKAGIPFHEVGPRATWTRTYLISSPFLRPGPLAIVPGATSRELMFRFDPFHTLHKGCFAELAGSALVMISDYGLVGSSGFDAQLASLYELLKEFCTRTKTPLHMDGLTRNLLNFKRDSDYPVGSWFKGADTAAVLGFLEEFLGNYVASLSVPDPYLESARDACRAANTFLRTRFCEPFTDMEFGFPVTLALWPQMPAGRSFAVIWN
ncbi:unnamed protein product, partial [Symbiodinium pilosum]